MFSTASAAAARIAGLTWFMIVSALAIVLLVIVIGFLAVMRGRSRDPARVDLSDPGRAWVMWGGIAFPAVVLLTILTWALRLMYALPTPSPGVTVLVTGHQWWWRLDYVLAGADSSLRFRTANELHVPVGVPVRLLLTSADVIHSFWVPQLHGKRDLIPGDTTALHIEASRVGRFAGACAEFCGAQHARMGITVVAEDPAAFTEWARREAADASTPRDSATTMGARLFASGPCSTCHTVRGLTTHADIGPDLTHVGSRLTLAAGTLENSLGAIQGWIANPQALKPGALMPRLAVYTGPELRALAAYVASLK